MIEPVLHLYDIGEALGLKTTEGFAKFDNGAVVENILSLVGVKTVKKVDFRQYKEENYNKLANLVRENVDLEYIYSTLQND